MFITLNASDAIFNKNLNSEADKIINQPFEKFIGTLFDNFTNPTFKVFLKRAVNTNYSEMAEYDIYDSENDDKYISFIKEQAKNNGISANDYLFDNPSYNMNKTLSICFGKAKKAESKGTKQIRENTEKPAQPRPITRENVIFTAFALNLDDADAEDLLMKGIKSQRFNFKNPYEVISFWCLRSNKSGAEKYSKFKELKQYVLTLEENGKSCLSTEEHESMVLNLNSEDELKEYLRTLKGWKFTSKDKIKSESSEASKAQFRTLIYEVADYYDNGMEIIEDSINEKIKEADEIENIGNKIVQNFYTDATSEDIKKHPELREYKKAIKYLEHSAEKLRDSGKNYDPYRWILLDESKQPAYKKAVSLRELYGEDSLKKTTKRAFEFLNKNKLTSDNINKIINGALPVERDHILTLGFFSYYNEVMVGRVSDDWLTELKSYGINSNEELVNDFADFINPYLEEARFNSFYLPGAMDSFVILCLLNESPIDCFRRFTSLEI